MESEAFGVRLAQGNFYMGPEHLCVGCLQGFTAEPFRRWIFARLNKAQADGHGVSGLDAKIRKAFSL
jgi:hypothetical protein